VPSATLITFPPSLDCELARFLLAHYRVPYQERRHAFIFNFFATLLHGCTLHFPLLYNDSYKLDTVRKMIDYFDPLCPADRNLLLAGAEHTQVESDWTLFNSTLGGATATFAYYHLLPLRDVMIRPLSEGTPAFEAYVADMLWAQRYAAANRDKMMSAALASLVDGTSRATAEIERINCHHNFAAREHHRGRDGWVVRKGAIRARAGDRGVIPGSMGTASFIVTGLGNEASFESCSHGAGRRMSRGEARRQLTPDSLGAAMKGKTWQSAEAIALVDEHPLAYKDVETVMAAQADLVRIDHRLTQVLNYKGTK